MKNTLHILLIIIASMVIMAVTSCLLDITWVKNHWVRQFIVLLLIFLQLIFTVLMLAEKVKRMAKKT